MTRRWPTSTAPSNSTPIYAWAIGSRGQTYQAMERYDEALADFNRAIELDPDLRLGHRQPRPDLPGDGAV